MSKYVSNAFIRQKCKIFIQKYVSIASEYKQFSTDDSKIRFKKPGQQNWYKLVEMYKLIHIDLFS